MESTLNVLLETFFELDHPRPVAQPVAISGAPNASENNPPGDSFGQLQGSMKAQKQAMFGWKINHPQTRRPKILELPCVMGLDYFVVIS